MKKNPKIKSSTSGIDEMMDSKDPITKFELVGIFIFIFSILITLDAPSSMGIVIGYFFIYNIGELILKRKKEVKYEKTKKRKL